jgi:hypothetical protein
LGALKAAKILQLFARLVARQILDRMKDRAGMRFDRDAIGWLQRIEIKRRHDGRQ